MGNILYITGRVAACYVRQVASVNGQTCVNESGRSTRETACDCGKKGVSSWCTVCIADCVVAMGRFRYHAFARRAGSQTFAVRNVLALGRVQHNVQGIALKQALCSFCVIVSDGFVDLAVTLVVVVYHEVPWQDESASSG